MKRPPLRTVIDIAALLDLLALLDKHPHVSRRELSHRLGLSGASITRLFKAARDVYGVQWTWDMRAGYTITNWGVLDVRRLRQRPTR